MVSHNVIASWEKEHVNDKDNFPKVKKIKYFALLQTHTGYSWSLKKKMEKKCGQRILSEDKGVGIE